MPYEGLTKATSHGPEWTGEVRLIKDVLLQPLQWKKPQRIFVNSMGDLFHEQVPDEFIRSVFAVMGEASHHIFQVLTKRPTRMQKLLTQWLDEGDFSTLTGGTDPPFPWPNVWIGVSVEDQQTADERIPLLLQTPAATRFVSCEPLLGPVCFTSVTLDIWDDGGIFVDALTGERWMKDGFERELDPLPAIDWIIVGGETGPGARPMHPDWVRAILGQCQKAGIPFFFKQWGEWMLVHELRCNEPGIRGRTWYNFDPDTAVCRIGKKVSGRLLDGREWNETP